MITWNKMISPTEDLMEKLGFEISQLLNKMRRYDFELEMKQTCTGPVCRITLPVAEDDTELVLDISARSRRVE